MNSSFEQTIERLAHQRRWLAGIAITVVSFGIQGVALGFGPLALVQPLVATERWPGSRFSATHRSCWQRNAENPGRPARRAARLRTSRDPQVP